MHCNSNINEQEKVQLLGESNVRYIQNGGCYKVTDTLFLNMK